jgi:glucose-1-phosphate thymidylyltransferase
VGVRAVILAGGYGIRLRMINPNNLPKPLILIKDKPIIDYIIPKIQELDVVKEIIVSTNTTFSDLFNKWLNEKGYSNVKIYLEESTSDEDKPGAIAALSLLIKKLGKDDYLVIGGDNLFTASLKDFVKYFQEKKKPVIAVYDVKDKEKVKEFSALTLNDENKVLEFMEKPKEPKSTLVGTCIYIFPKDIIPLLHEYILTSKVKDQTGKFIEWLIKKVDVYAYKLKGLWWDIGTPETYFEAKAHLQNPD